MDRLWSDFTSGLSSFTRKVQYGAENVGTTVKRSTIGGSTKKNRKNRKNSRKNLKSKRNGGQIIGFNDHADPVYYK